MAKVLIDRDGCISCGVCWSTCPDVFEQNPDDNLSQVVQEYRQGGNPAAGEVSGQLGNCAREGADGCPVSVIHVD